MIRSHSIVDVSNNPQVLKESEDYTLRNFFITIVFNRKITDLDEDLQDYKDYLFDGYRKFFESPDGFRETLQVKDPHLSLDDIDVDIKSRMERSIINSYLHFHTLVKTKIPGRKQHLSINFSDFGRIYREMTPGVSIMIKILNANPNIENIDRYIEKYS